MFHHKSLAFYEELVLTHERQEKKANLISLISQQPQICAQKMRTKPTYCYSISLVLSNLLML